MKNFTLITCFFFVLNANSQIIYHFCFDSLVECSNYGQNSTSTPLKIDVVANPNNIWQIGSPQKNVFNMAQSAPNVIVTDSINSYPNSDTSSFIIGNLPMTGASSSISWYHTYLQFDYFVDSDTLTDFGLIEFSADNGNTWIDLINDPAYTSYLNWDNNTPPVLSGNSGGWQNAILNFGSLGQSLNIPDGTILLWRFTFISDAIQNNKDGLMFDNIQIEITPPLGLTELNTNTEKKLVKIVDYLGRETAYKPNCMMIYLYSDGTSEKVFQTE